MAQQQRQWITVDECVNSYLNISEQGVHKYFKLWHIAFDGMNELGLNIFYQVKSIKIAVNSNKTAYLPTDYLNYTKIGVGNANGEVIPLKYNTKLTFFADLAADRLAKTQDNTLLSYYNASAPIFYNFWNGSLFTNLYGAPSGSPFVGNFNIDNNAGVILLNDTFQYTYLILEYIASPQESEEYMIPMQFKQALIAYMGWQDIQYTPNSRKGNLGDKRDRKHEFYNQRRLAKAAYKPLHLQDAYEWSLENQRMTVKS
jgi:hypothetical protein